MMELANTRYRPTWLVLPDYRPPPGLTSGAGTSNNCAANQTWYLPFQTPHHTGLVDLSVFMGSGAANYDLGLYDEGGTRLGSKGTTARSSSVWNTWTPSSPLALAANTIYWAAFSCSAANAIYGHAQSLARALVWNLCVEAAGPALPSTATFTPITSGSLGATPVLYMSLSG